MKPSHQKTSLATAILVSLAVISANAYTLPDLPPMPLVTPAPANSMPMGDPANFPEVKMDFPIETNGPFQPTWSSIAANVPGNGTPAWLRQAKFGIWFHYGPQANLQSGDWSAQHMYQQGADAYNFHLNNFGYCATNGYKDVLRAWAPTNYSPAGLAQLFYNAGARFVMVQGVHHDNFDNWNSKYNPWNMMNFGAKRDTMAEWTNALRSLGMHFGVAFHHEYSWWFTQPDFLSDSSGPFAGVPYDAVTATNSAGTWWQNYDVRRLYNQDLHKYQGISTPTTGYWSPSSGIFTNDLDYCHWYATQWALRILDVVETYNPDFIYTDGDSSQPFSGYGTGTGYKCDAMERVIAHYYNRTLERHGQLDTLAVVKFHNGDHIGTTFENGYSSTIKEDQPWFAEMAIGNWFWAPGISYDNGGAIVQRLLEAISRDGAMMVNIPNRPDGSFDNYSASNSATNMLAGVGQWMAVNSEGVYGSRAWVTPTDGNFRFTVGTNGCLYAYYLGIPAGGTQLTIPSLATTSNLLIGAIGSVSLLGSASNLVWSQTSAGLVVTCPSTMPTLPSGTAIGFKIGPASAVGTVAPTSLIALPETNGVSLSWSYLTTAATFKMKRSTAHGGPYTTIATNIAGFAFTDTNVSPATLYFYVVSAVSAGGESVNSSETSASLVATPAGNWLTEDVGAVGATGSFNLSSGKFTVQGSGADIWNSGDEFRYVFQALTGNCSFTARVLNMQNTAGWAKAGLMIRETLDPSSKYVINFMSPANGTALQQRDTTGGSASGVSNNTGLAAPYWLRLVRTNDTFTAFISADGTNWIQSGTTTVAMNANVYVGLAVCSHNDGTICQAQFDSVPFSNSTSTVVSSALPPLIHRYSFNETSGSTAHDSVGGANGTLNGSAAFDGNGHVVLNGTSGTYVSLPGNLIAGLTDVTIEAWVTNSTSPDNVALFSFDDGLQDGVGGGYLRFVLHDQSNGRNFLELASSGGSPLLAANPGLGGSYVHVVCTYSQTTGTAVIYTNGVLEATMAVSTPLANVSANAAALGNSPWSSDPNLKGAIDEFRIYSGVLTPADIAAAQAVGPNVVLTTNVSVSVSPGGGTMNFSWPVAASGFTLESSPVLGSGAVWTSITGVPLVVGSNNQVAVPLNSGNGSVFFRLLRP
jgi:alpha-L-fucosidase